MEKTEMAEATRSCLYTVLDRFNSDDPFWGSFVPDPRATELKDDRFSVTLRGAGVSLEVCGVVCLVGESDLRLAPTVVVAARLDAAPNATRSWFPVSCTVDASGRLITSNFREAIESSIDTLELPARAM